MIKKSFRLMLLVAFALSSVMFVACNKYDEDINDLYSKYDDLSAAVQSLKAAVDGGAVITSVSNTAEGVKFTLSNGQSYTVNHGTAGKDGQNGQDGKDGKPGSVVTIGENGNWFIDGEDQGINATQPYVVNNGAWYSLYVMEQVDGANAEVVEVKLPATATITSLKAIPAIGKDGKITAWGVEGVELVYGTKVDNTSSYKASNYTFNGKTYAKGSFLFAKSNKFSAYVNPSYTDASMFTFKLVDSKGNSPYVVGTPVQNMTEKALTKADATANAGVWDMTIGFPEGVPAGKEDTREAPLYALAAVTAEGLVMSEYEIKVTEKAATNVTFAAGTEYVSTIKDAGKRVIDLTKVITDDENVVDYYFELVNPSVDGAKGIVLDGYTITAPASYEGTIDLNMYVLLVNSPAPFKDIAAKSVKAVFEHVALTGSLDKVTWSVQEDDTDTKDVDETMVYIPLGDLQSALNGDKDAQLPKISVVGWTWADGTALDKVSVVRNNKYYGKDVTGKTVTKFATLLANGSMKFPQVALYYVNGDGKYVKAGHDNAQKPLYVGFRFTGIAHKVFPGDYAVTLGLSKATSSVNDYEVPVEVSIVAPEQAIVKYENYFSGNNAVAYGDAKTTPGVAVYNLNNLFKTPGLSFAETTVKDSKGNAYDKWLSGSVVTVPTYDQYTDHNKTVYATREYTASIIPFSNDFIEATTYAFNLTIKSEIKEGSFTTAASKEIKTNEAVKFFVSEFTGVDVYGDSFYVGNTYKYNEDGKFTGVDKSIDSRIVAGGVKIEAADQNAKDYLTIGAMSSDTTKDYPSDFFSVSRKSEITQLVQDTPCTVKVVITDIWGMKSEATVTVVLKAFGN